MSVPTYAGLSELLEGIRSVNGLAAERVERLAVGLLDGLFAGEPETVSRRNAITDVSQQIGVGGPDRRVAARLLAEAWQVLELNGLICRDPEQTQGEWWFLTRSGHEFVNRRDREGAELSLPTGSSIAHPMMPRSSTSPTPRSSGGMMKFEVYETAAGNSRWRLIAGNGQEIANGGENFASRSNARRAAESFKVQAEAATYEVYASGDHWRWRAKARNGQITASSGEPFASEANARRAAHNVRESARLAGEP